MASIIRQIVSGPRARHPEAGLDLCYVTDFIVVTSGPSSIWPRKAYRNPVDQLVAFLDKKHGEGWAIFEFRAEGTGYPDEEVYNRVHHFPWPDHHPPPFAIIPNLMAAMRNWLHATPGEGNQGRVAVVHCKAGKGRSGTVACSYLISQEGWRIEDALKRFTTRRMRAGFGEGVSIPSQLRWVRYVDRWTNSMRKQYVEKPVEIVEIQVWGLRSGVKVSVEGYVDEGKRIKCFHTFVRKEKTVIGPDPAATSTEEPPSKQNTQTLVAPDADSAHSSRDDLSTVEHEISQDVVLKPSEPIRLDTSDINIDFERRNKSSFTGFTMVTSIAHVWFNAYFEGGHEGHDSGLFEIDWEAMDGIKGSARKGIKALDRLKVVWRYASAVQGQAVPEPDIGEAVKEGRPADWKGQGNPEKEIEAKHSEGVDSGRPGGTTLTLKEMSEEAANMLAGKRLGLRKSQAESVDISRASSVRDEGSHSRAGDISAQDSAPSEDEGVQTHFTGVDQSKTNNQEVHESYDHERADTAVGKYLESAIGKISGMMNK